MTELELITEILEHIAEQHGDITEHVMARYYARHPKMEELFLCKGLPFKTSLEGQMVNDSLYIFLQFAETPIEAEMVLKYAMPQHDSYQIPHQAVISMLECVTAFVIDELPEHLQSNGEKCWLNIQNQLVNFINQY